MFFINRVVDVGFFTDIFLNFRVARFDRQTGTWITDRKAVALIYVRSTFLIDFLSTVPWDLLSFVVDVGNSINPAIDVGQIEGAFVQGLGWLTTEELVRAITLPPSLPPLSLSLLSPHACSWGVCDCVLSVHCMMCYLCTA